MPVKKRFTDEELRARKNARTAQRYRENKEQIAAYHALLHQSKKSDPDYMRRMAEKSAAYREANPGVVSRQNAKRRNANPEESRRQVREWFAKNPDKRIAYEQNRRAKKRERGGKLPADIVVRLMGLQRGKCACCRCDLTEAKPNIDHIVPLALGGEHSELNVQLLCQPCNNSKHAKHPIDFMQSRGYLL